MTTKARTVVQSALGLLRVVAEGETMSAEQATDGLRVMNEMLHGLKGEGINLGYADIELDDDLPLPNEHIRPVRFLLAVDLAAEYGSALTPEVSVGAQNGRKILRAAYRQIDTLKTDRALHSRIYRRYNGWSASNG